MMSMFRGDHDRFTILMKGRDATFADVSVVKIENVEDIPDYAAKQWAVLSPARFAKAVRSWQRGCLYRV